ncbi:MAG TPA: PQQ-binding-like beta-propeller repeat protein, partial [Pseudorhizobium sp.]|nr:PQQ-binding-like beta-propeller repeat protein [Pseudorhizobium sp.]
MAILVTAILLALVGIVLGIGGTQLLMLGGSPYYLIAGIGFLVTAVLLFMRRQAALVLYAVIVIASLIWAVWEVGLDWWQLGPRGGVIILLGIWLLTPWIRKPLGFRSPTGARYAAGATPLAASVAIAILVAIISMFVNSTDLDGNLPEEQIAAAPDLGGDVPPGEWHQYGRTPYGQRYSPLDQVNVDNVDELEEVWRYQTGDVKLPEDVGETTYQVTPLKIGNSLFICTPHNWAISINATTGEEQWKYDPNAGLNPDRQHQTCRGVTYYADPAAQPNTPCAQRVYLPTSDARLIALDAANGQVCTSFAQNGTLQLEQGMPYNPAGYYYSTSPPVIVDGKIIIGGAVNDNYSVKSPSGVIRAFDVNSGELIWNWDSGNPSQTAPLPPGQTYSANSPNSWSIFSVDEDLGLVYIPLGNQVPDQLGMNRSESVEKYASSIVALDINTGADRWVRQTVHHDLWDMDVPAQPVLLDLTKPDGTVVPALVGPTKQGDIYVLDRRNGEPLLPITEQPAPGGAIPEDFTAPTQPVTALTFRPRPLDGRDMWGITMFDQMVCRIRLKQLKYEG